MPDGSIGLIDYGQVKELTDKDVRCVAVIIMMLWCIYTGIMPS